MGTLNIGLAVIFAALQAGDTHTTIRILKPGGRELNPFMRALMGRFGFKALIVIKAAACAAVAGAAFEGSAVSGASDDPMSHVASAIRCADDGGRTRSPRRAAGLAARSYSSGGCGRRVPRPCRRPAPWPRP
jgi:hypothetical protein